MFDFILYLLVFLAVIGGLGVWIMKARSALKSAGRSNMDNDQSFSPPSE